MRPSRLCLLLSLPLLIGCAGSACRTPVLDSGITPSAAAAAGAPLGATVQWGGTLVASRHLRDSTELEVIGYPLDGCGRPRTGSASSGRFVIRYPGFLETTDYRAGRLVSATGRISTTREGKRAGADDRYPVLETYKVRLWPQKRGGARGSAPWVNIGIGGGSGGVHGGVGVIF